jgi:tRNA(Ile)-lysidine synthase
MAVSRKRPPEGWAPLRAALAAALADAQRATGGITEIAVGYSGGLDSSVLLDALARLREAAPWRLRAVHVNHGLSPHARAWQEYCAAACAALDVPLSIHAVEVARRARLSREEEARRARYRVLRAAPVDLIALAHHADDQAETLLLQLLRGAGPRGLAGMPRLAVGEQRPWLWRPLLGLPRSALERYARARGLGWIDDESNADIALKRNFVRHRVMPVLAQGFPAPATTLARAATLQAEAAALLGALGRGDLAAASHDGVIDCRLVAALPRERQANLLREWLAGHGMRAPSAARLRALQDGLAGKTGALVWEHAGRRVLRRGTRLALEPAGTPATTPKPEAAGEALI